MTSVEQLEYEEKVLKHIVDKMGGSLPLRKISGSHGPRTVQGMDAGHQ